MNDHNSLGFLEYVQKAFIFLKLEYDFLCTNQSETNIRFEGNGVFVSIYFGRQSYEIGLEIGLIEDRLTNGYGLGSLISYHRQNKDKQFRFSIAKTREQVNFSVNDLAKLLKECGKKALRGDKNVYRQLKSDANAYWEDIRTSKIRIDAAKSFSKGDYKTSISLYEKISNNLSPSENKKIKIAKNKVR